MANKAELETYAEAPFFKPDPRRIAECVAWTGGAEQQEKVFWKLAELIGDRIEYLLKETVDQNGDEMVWRRVSGGIFRSDLVEVIGGDSELFFHDSGFQFCARSPETDDYFAYDEHGIFWIYSKDPRYLAHLREAGLAERDVPLICDFGHWHVRPKNAEERLEKFIGLLRERSQFSERENPRQTGS
jgi:hypothetical protein